MKHRHFAVLSVAVALAIGAAAIPGCATEIQAGALKLHLDPVTGNVDGLSVGATRVPLRASDALFHVCDIKAHSGFVPLTGPVHGSDGHYVMQASAPSLGLTARIAFHEADGMIVYRAEIEDMRRQERGLVVTMTLPLQPRGLIWSGDLYTSAVAKPGILYGNNLTPVSAVSAEQGAWALASAIPPTAPVMYDTNLKDGDFGLDYYVGISSAPRELSGRTWIAGLLYNVNPDWGFRAALQKYYQAYPDFYTRKVPRTGAWCTDINATNEAYASGCGFYEVGGGEWKRLHAGSRMGTNIAETPRQWVEMNHIREAKRLGVLIFPYTIVGQRQIFMLPGNDLYTDYGQAIALFDKWTTDVAMPYQNPANANSYDSVAELKEIVRNSGLHQQDGRFVIVPRMYTGNTLTFPLNPNPRLFFDRPDQTIAKYTLDDYVPKLLQAAPEIDGFYVDSMGSWNDFTNYRRDHFAYAKYPLAVDLDGNPVLRNLSSTYEYVEEFRKRMHAQHKFVFLNGLNGGNEIRNGTNDYVASRPTSRFFLAALDDYSGIESGSKTPLERMEQYRIMSGQKPYAIMAYGNKAGEDSQFPVYFKRAAALGIFPSAGARLYTVPALEPLVKPLHQYYLPLIQKLNDAGWQPVTGMTGEGPGILCERFGQHRSIYITLYNDTAQSTNLTLHLTKAILGSPHSVVAIDGEAPTTFAVHDGELKLSLKAAQLRVIQIFPRESTSSGAFVRRFKFSNSPHGAGLARASSNLGLTHPS